MSEVPGVIPRCRQRQSLPLQETKWLDLSYRSSCSELRGQPALAVSSHVELKPSKILCVETNAASPLPAVGRWGMRRSQID